MSVNKSNFASNSDKDTVLLLDEISLWSAPFGEMLLNEVKYKIGLKFLDIGYGTGFPLIELSQRLDKSEGYGIDPWNEGSDRAEYKINKMGIKNIKLIRDSAEKIPFENNYFDLIVSNNGINNVNNIDDVLKECYRVLKNNGQFIFTINLPDTMKEFYYIYKKILKINNMLNYIDKVNEHIFKKRMLKSEIIKKVIKSGFHIKKKSEKTFYIKFSNGTSLFNHFFMKLAFIKSWLEILPEESRDNIFNQIIEILNVIAEKENGIKLTIPMICIDCSK